MSGFIKGKTPAQRAWVRGLSTKRAFQESAGDLEVMSNCDWLPQLHPVDHARLPRFDFPKSVVQARGHHLFPARSHKPR